jgi:hypothetical protein
LNVANIDLFLIDKIKKKLSYWCFVHLSLVGRIIIVNSILVLSLGYFGVFWGVPPKLLGRLNHYFGISCGEEQNTQLGLEYNVQTVM